MAKTSEKKRKSIAEYDAKTARHFGMKLNRNTDPDIIAKLESVDSIQTYVKELIRKDIESGSYKVFHKIEVSELIGIFETADDAIHFVADYSLEHGEDLNPAECNFEIIGPDGKIDF